MPKSKKPRALRPQRNDRGDARLALYAAKAKKEGGKTWN